MGNSNFGRLEQIKNIRNHWPREDTDFTPWLSNEDNMSILGETIGIELEVLDQERSVGPFRADILCKNTADNTLVLIENQLEKTNHSHLGQLFTYAAGLDAVTLIWIVEAFTEEHRAALDWLNRITDEKFHFFGIEIELWRIGNSSPAPKFNIVSKPNDWAKTVKESADASRSKLTPWQELQVKFWKQFGNHMTSVDAPFKAPKPYPSLWMGYGIGRSYTNMIVSFSQKKTWVYVNIDNKKRPAWFHDLINEQEEIHSEFGSELLWEERPTLQHSRIETSQEIDMTDQDNWPPVFEWMLKNMILLKKIFKPRVKALSEAVAETQENDSED